MAISLHNCSCSENRSKSDDGLGMFRGPIGGGRGA